MCYKNKKTIYMLSDKYAILNSHYYTIQLILGLCNSLKIIDEIKFTSDVSVEKAIEIISDNLVNTI